MQKRTLKEKILNKRNKGLGLTFVLISLLMIFSLILFPYKYNPIFLIEILLMTVLGFGGLFIFLLLFLMITLYYYLDVRISWFTRKRFEGFTFLLLTIFWFIAIILNSLHIDYQINEIHSFVDYWQKSAVDPFMNIVLAENTPWGERTSFVDMFRFMGFVDPIIFWILGGFWWNSLITLITLIVFILYFTYVLITGEYTFLLSKLQFWRNEKHMINIGQITKGIDLNQSTEEFEMNFDELRKSNETLELVERVRKNMNKKNYEELSNKIAEEKKKLTDLRQRVLAKVKKSKEEYLSQSKVSDSHRQEILTTLGYTNYSTLVNANKQQEAKAAQDPFQYKKPETYVEENQIEENKELINDGYKTTEDVYDINEPTLTDTFAEDMLQGFEPTTEVPLLENYAEIFEKEEELVNEINKTLETIIKLEEELVEEKEKTGEVIIDGLDHLTTMEQYLSIPDVIAKSDELEISIHESDIIHEQQEDRTQDSEYSSIDQSDQSDEIIRMIDSEPQVGIEQKNEVDETQSDDDSFRQSIEDNQVVEEEEEEKEWCNPYVLPSTSILTSTAVSFDNSVLVQEATTKASNLNTTFQSFGVGAQVNSFEIGPTITTFKITLEPGIKTTKVTNLEDNIKLALGAEYIRIIAPIPGTSFIGIEIPNSTKRPVLFKTVYDETNASNEGIVISIGQDVSGKSLSFDLTKAPHLLVAGSTGSGKSVAINTILSSILLRYRPTDVQLVLVDPKMVEFAPFHGVPHLLAEVITDAVNAKNALVAMVEEMEERYRKMASMGAKKIEELNAKLIEQGEKKLPYIVIVIDELADLMMVAAKEVEDSIMRITQKARAAGIHMVIATQRPSTEIITGTIKSNIPSRMAFTVASSIDSRTILGQVGAEKLIGMGDMLVSLYGQLPFRGQGAYISNEEVDDIAAFTKSQCSANYKIDVQALIELGNPMSNALISTNDPLYIAAKDLVISQGKAATSMLQRHMGIGYNKAANIIETLEAEGVIGPAKGSQPREVLV